ncbi:MAG TPA: Rne/Rng family ribonuclease, partial [Stellaceae bacterium]|nr:Rne/Rng family ribonuclease [Stellaceae bacterium]
VTRVEPSLQAAFVEYGGNRHGFLAFNEIHPDYYRIPVADRRAIEQAGYARDEGDEDHPAESDHSADTEAGGNGRRPEEANRYEETAGALGIGGDDAPHAHDEEIREAGDAIPRPEAGEPGRDAALPADASGEDVIYERPGFEDSALAGIDHEPANPFAAHENQPQAQPEPEPRIQDRREEGHATAAAEDIGEPSSQVGEEGPGAPESGEHNGNVETVTHDRRDEDGQQGEDAIETVGGGDEIEEAPRPRARPHRHYKIQEVIKRRQIMLVQVTKEERGNKGAALTTFLSLAGRYCVLMPNTPRGGGVSRKITNATDRRRLKDLMSDLDVPEGMGVIVRTAGSERSKPEIKRDFEYLLRLWDDIRDLTLKSTAPALIYEEGNLIKRSIRDLYTRDLEEVIVDGEEGYRTAKAFMKMLMPSHAKRIKPYHDPSVPLFHRYQVEGQIDAIHSPIVQLRSGGYIVINPTEALVAIDVNSGRSTKERNIEETALKTNVEAAEEIARQLRLRDLAGLIVIDFIDMEEHRNQATVERKLKDAMRHDRARIQLGRISPFGLLELSRQRLRPSLLEASTQPCPHCSGTGHIRSTESTALHVLRAIEEEGMRRRSAEISVAVPTAVALYILNHKRDTLVHIEARYGFRVTIGSDDALVPPAFRLERLRALTPAEIAALPAPVAPTPQPEPEDEEFEEEEHPSGEESTAAEAEAPESAESEPRSERSGGDDGQGRRRRRRRRRGWRGEEGREGIVAAPASTESAPVSEVELPPAVGVEADEEETGEGRQSETSSGETGTADPAAEQSDFGGGRKRRRRGRRGGRRRRRGEPGGEGQPQPTAYQETEGVETMPIAEMVEYVPPPPAPEVTAAEIVEALTSSPVTPSFDAGAENVPVSEQGDASERPEPAPPAAKPETMAEPSSPATSHNVVERPANPKRGWWRRVIDS